MFRVDPFGHYLIPITAQGLSTLTLGQFRSSAHLGLAKRGWLGRSIATCARNARSVLLTLTRSGFVTALYAAPGN
jgi:hypothetical protein